MFSFNEEEIIFSTFISVLRLVTSIVTVSFYFMFAVHAFNWIDELLWRVFNKFKSKR
jgi:hypothetical protein